MQQQEGKKYIVNVIRHAQSEFNLAQENFGGLDAVGHAGAHLESKDIKFSDQLLDCGITKLGVEQTKRGRESVKERNIKLVLVSPLLRAIQTCEEVFKGHQKQPKMIVHPLFREMLLSNCDIGSNILQSKIDFPNYDFSFIEKYENPKIWPVYELNDKKKSDEIVAQIKEKCRNNQEEFMERGHLALLEIMRNNFPVKFETQKDTNDRSYKQKEFIREIAKKYNIQEGEEIAIVGHSRNLQAFTATEFNEDDSVKDGVWLENCEVKQIPV